MDLKGAAGGVGVSGTLAAVLDVLVTGGDVVFWFAGFALDQGPILYVLLGRLMSLAPAVPWLPAAKIQTAFYVVAAVVAIVALYRLVRNFRRSWSNRNDS